MAGSTLQYRLEPAQIQHFEDEGYLIIERLFTDDELQPVIEEVGAELDRRCRDAVAACTLSRTYEEYDFEHRLTHVDAENQAISKSMWDNKVVLPSFFGRMTHPKLLEVVRWSMDLRYESAALPTNAKITHLPGEAVSSTSAGVPLACYPPEPDFLVRSQLRPHEVLKTPEEFVALGMTHIYHEATDRWGYSVAKRKDPLGNPYPTGDPKDN